LPAREGSGIPVATRAVGVELGKGEQVGHAPAAPKALGGEINIGAAAVVIKEVQGCLHAMHALAPAVLLSPVGYGDQALTAGVDECVLFPFVTPSTIAYGNERTMNALPYTLRGISMQYHKM
jgi:hypothetical protein